MARKKTKEEPMSVEEKALWKRWDRQRELLEHLKKNPNMEWASRKTGIHRSTVYRWMNNDKEFMDLVGLAMREGTVVMNDIMESLLVQAAKNQKVGAITFWLRNRHPLYVGVRLQEKMLESRRNSNESTDLTPEEQEEIDRSFKLWEPILKKYREMTEEEREAESKKWRRDAEE